MVAARSDAAVEALPGTASDEERALAFAKAIARIAVTNWEGVGDADGNPVPVTPEGIDGPARDLANCIGEAATSVRKDAPLVGQLEARGPTSAKSYSESLLKTPQGQAYSRLLAAEFRRSFCNATGVRDLVKELEQVPVEVPAELPAKLDCLRRSSLQPSDLGCALPVRSTR